VSCPQLTLSRRLGQPSCGLGGENAAEVRFVEWEDREELANKISPS
jgi:hypothetical protein